MPFNVSIVTEKEELKELFRLRYKVYCEEWDFEKPEKYPDRYESDEYDQYAVHFAVRDLDQKVVGTARLILNSPEGFPAEKYCQIDIDNSIPKEKIAEISRLIIHRDYRRRSEDKYIYGPDEERRIIGSFNYSGNYTNSNFQYRRTDDRYRHRQGSSRSRGSSTTDRRNRHELVTYLYKALYHESKRRGLTHCYAVMTKGLTLLLGKFGIKFQAVGDPVDYHGIRTPYLGDISKIEKELSISNPDVYEEFTKDLV